jgi:hypothetical protein
MTPTKPGRLHLKLHVMSDTYISSNYEMNMTMDVHPRIRPFGADPAEEDAKSWKTKTTLRGFNSSTGIKFSAEEISEVSALHKEFKSIQEEERKLALEGKDKPPELVARRAFVDSRIQKWKSRRAAKEDDNKTALEEGNTEAEDCSESFESKRERWEKAWARRFAIRKWPLKGLDAMIPDTLMDLPPSPYDTNRNKNPVHVETGG